MRQEGFGKPCRCVTRTGYGPPQQADTAAIMRFLRASTRSAKIVRDAAKQDYQAAAGTAHSRGAVRRRDKEPPVLREEQRQHGGNYDLLNVTVKVSVAARS